MDDFSCVDGVDVESAAKACTRACGARTELVLLLVVLDVVADEMVRLEGASGIGFDTFLLGTLVPNLSSVALSLACSSCKSLNPFVFAEVELTTLTGEATVLRPLVFAIVPCVLVNGEGDDGPATLARLRVLVERAKDGSPEGDLVIPVLVRRTEGDARLASEAVVLDLGKGVRVVGV